LNRQLYFDYIEGKLNTLAYRIEIRGKLNLTDIHILSESFFADLFNLIFSYKLKDANIEKQNIASVDLIDAENKILVQVSAVNTKEKIDSSLSKEILKEYTGYRFIFICISKDASNLKSKTFTNPFGMKFVPDKDIYDIPSLLRIIESMPAAKQKEIAGFLKDELEPAIIPIEKIDSDLSLIITILSGENLDGNFDSPELNAYEIDRKVMFNKLQDVSEIPDYKIYYDRLDEKYRECDAAGVNKRLSVYHTLRKIYKKLVHESKMSGYDIFYEIIEEVKHIIQNSKNYTSLPSDELDLCVSIVVVDAFIRCKIFENPEHYTYAAT
jgi:hypothetical protein